MLPLYYSFKQKTHVPLFSKFTPLSIPFRRKQPNGFSPIFIPKSSICVTDSSSDSSSNASNASNSPRNYRREAQCDEELDWGDEEKNPSEEKEEIIQQDSNSLCASPIDVGLFRDFLREQSPGFPPRSLSPGFDYDTFYTEQCFDDCADELEEAFQLLTARDTHARKLVRL